MARAFDRDTAEAIASGWGRRRAFVEEMATPVREWMVRALAPQPGDTILELAAGAGQTGFQFRAWPSALWRVSAAPT